MFWFNITYQKYKLKVIKTRLNFRMLSAIQFGIFYTIFT